MTVRGAAEEIEVKNQFNLGNLIITTPSPWKDITESVELSSVPFTLAKEDGTGALQFSLATYRGGLIPNSTINDLDGMRSKFAQSKNFGAAFDEIRSTGDLSISGGSYKAMGDYVRVWYCSEGKSFVLVTYIAVWGTEGNEPKECDAIVAGLRFR